MNYLFKKICIASDHGGYTLKESIKNFLVNKYISIIDLGPFENKFQAENAISYITTKFFRFLVLLKKNPQNAAKGVYSFVPMQNFDEKWDDEKLFNKYKLTRDEVLFIESMVRPMTLKNEKND